jgi:hypothetical protein
VDGAIAVPKERGLGRWADPDDDRVPSLKP